MGGGVLEFSPTPKQQLALSCPCDFVLFGGARGGGKSHCSYLKIIQHGLRYASDANMIFLRKGKGEVVQNIDEFRKLAGPLGRWNARDVRFEFSNGAVASFDFLRGDKVLDYQGHQYTLIVYDELGNFASVNEIDLMRACLRSGAGVPCQVFATCNPGGPLHNILKTRYIDAGEPMQPVADGWDTRTGEPNSWSVYIPSTLLDNPYLLNDPSYVSRLKQVGSPEMVKAWLLGDWDVIAGGAFDKIFDRRTHVVKPFHVPGSWRVIEVYDDGVTKPYCATWIAVSDGSDFMTVHGESCQTTRGDMFVIGEYYGMKDGIRDMGTCESVESKARHILDKEHELEGYGLRISQRIADSAIFSSMAHSVADDFEANGVVFEPCQKAPGTRRLSVNLFRNRLMASMERQGRPGIYWFSTCRNHIMTIPVLPRSQKDPEDVDTHAEDHALDTILYALLSEDMNNVGISYF